MDMRNYENNQQDATM